MLLMLLARSKPYNYNVIIISDTVHTHASTRQIKKSVWYILYDLKAAVIRTAINRGRILTID